MDADKLKDLANSAQLKWKSMAVKLPRLTMRRKVKRLAGLAALYTIIGIGAIFVFSAMFFQMAKMDEVVALADHQPSEAIKIYDRYDSLAAVVPGEEDRQTISLSQVAPMMQKAMLAAEDHNFYNHSGYSLSGMFRAAMVNLQAGRVVEGGSTITQQLVKNLFFPKEQRTIFRKIKEILLASEVERRYQKDKILEMYLNQVYFGNLAYGIERAAQRYFNKPASKLNLAESAFLAGLVKAPSELSRKENRKDAVERQQYLLDRMVEYNYISQQEADAAKKQKLAFKQFNSPYEKYPFYVSYVMDVLRARCKPEQLKNGLRVYTNMDQSAQKAAEDTLQKAIKGAPRGITQFALVSVDVNTGGVLSLVGGVGDFEKHQWNRAVSPHTLGSSFKPFVYLTGFMHGAKPEDTILDSPISFANPEPWSPRNFDNTFKGPMSIRKALALSRNVCAVRMAASVGIQNVIDTARMAGIHSQMEPYLPISLGAAAASPMEMAGAYSTFARYGVAIEPQVLRRIEENNGDVIAAFESRPRKVFDTAKVVDLVDVMQSVITEGTGRLAKLDGRPVAGKTGTTDGHRDVWFVGYTPDISTAVWGGNDHNQRIGSTAVTGGMVMAKIWKSYMEKYYATHPTAVTAFISPPALQKQRSIIASAGGTLPDTTSDDAAAAKERKRLNDLKTKTQKALSAKAEPPRKSYIAARQPKVESIEAERLNSTSSEVSAEQAVPTIVKSEVVHTNTQTITSTSTSAAQVEHAPAAESTPPAVPAATARPVAAPSINVPPMELPPAPSAPADQ